VSGTNPTLQAEPTGTEMTRFNALKHGILSRYIVLPWEDRSEYEILVTSLVVEHGPQGPTEEHLVEELAGILWRKRRLRLAEAAAHRLRPSRTGGGRAARHSRCRRPTPFYREPRAPLVRDPQERTNQQTTDP
jgi:hypothetical protein